MSSRENSAAKLIAAIVAVLLSSLTTAQCSVAQTQPSSAPAILRISGSNVANPLSLSAADLRAMPRKTLKVANPHDKKTEVYQGVSLSDLFRKAGAPMGHELRGSTMTTYVLAEAGDGYKVIFSPAELDSDFTDADDRCRYARWRSARPK